MSIGHMKTGFMTAVVYLAMAVAASAQVSPFALGETGDIDYFAQPDLSSYGQGVIPNVGYWGSLEYLLWATTTPKKVEIGNQGGSRAVYDSNFGTLTQFNAADTGFIRASLESGTRYELGYMGDDDRGWFVSGWRLFNHSDRLFQTNAAMVFKPLVVPVTDLGTGATANRDILDGFVDIRGAVPNATAGSIRLPDGYADDVDNDGVYGPDGRDVGTGIPPAAASPPDGIPDTIAAIDFGDMVALPLVFSQLTARHTSDIYSVELNRAWRLRRLGVFGGSVEGFAGARYMNFNDRFTVEGLGGILADSNWDMNINNRIVGGQIGLRWIQKTGRMSFIGEGRLFAGANLQTARLNGVLGSQLTTINPGDTFTNGTSTANGPVTSYPNNIGPSNINASRLNQPAAMFRTGFSSSRNYSSFSPMGELRAKLQYQVFESVSVNAGWTGTFVDGIMRSTNMIDYQLPAMQIFNERKVQGVFINGITLGMEINR